MFDTFTITTVAGDNLTATGGILTDADRTIIDSMLTIGAGATRVAFGLHTYGAPDSMVKGIPHIGRCMATSEAVVIDGGYYCPTCYSTDHLAPWVLPVVLHVDGWKIAARAYVTAAHGAEAMDRFNRGLRRITSETWVQGYGCAACNSDDDDHSDARLCGRTCSLELIPQCCHAQHLARR
jgi:hypothetical protein